MTLIIQNGFVVDGSGKPGFLGDVIVEGDRIVDVIPTASHGRDAFPTRPRTARIPRAKRAASAVARGVSAAPTKKN